MWTERWKTKNVAACDQENEKTPSNIPALHLASARRNKYSGCMIVGASQVHILPVSKQPGDWRNGKGKDRKAMLLNPQAFCPQVKNK